MSISSSALTYPPQAGDSLGAVRALLAAGDNADPAAPGQHHLLSAAGSGQGVEVPEQVLEVAVVPVAKSVSTTQAAVLLEVSRPTVVKLLEQGATAYQQAGSRRRIDLSEVMVHRQARREAQYADLDALGGDDDEPLDEQMLARLKTTRALLGQRRRATTAPARAAAS